MSNEWDDGWGKGPNNGIEDQLILTNPKSVVWIRKNGCCLREGSWWTWFGTINKPKEVISNEQGLEL